jgi:hypothetical protein
MATKMEMAREMEMGKEMEMEVGEVDKYGEGYTESEGDGDIL